MIRSISTVMLCGTAISMSAVVPATDPVLLGGLSPYNWVCGNETISTAVAGSSLSVAFKGTRNVSLMVDTTHLAGWVPTRGPVIAWSINGGREQSHQLVAGESEVTLATGIENPVIDFYVKGMSPFENRWDGELTANSVRIRGIGIDHGGKSVAVRMPGKVWLNIGDSIMSGDAAGYGANQGRPGDALWAGSSDSRASYGFLLAKHFGYRESRIAYGGYNWGGGMAGVPALSTLIDQQTSKASRVSQGLLSPPPDVVLINLGENGVPAEGDVVDALVKLRARAGRDARLLVMAPISGRGAAEIESACNRYTNESKDARLHFIHTPDFRFATADGQHPTAAGHHAVFQAARPIIGRLIESSQRAEQRTGDVLGAPFWETNMMRKEPVLFVREAGDPFATGKLIFAPVRELVLLSPDLNTRYEQGRDYVWKPGSQVVTLTSDSRIPFKTAEEMFPPPGSPNTLEGVLFFEGGFFHDLQVQAGYKHAGSWSWRPAKGKGLLTRSLSRLKERKLFRIVALGDSITEGYNASGFAKVDRPPHQPPYVDLVAAGLEMRFGADVSMVNMGLGGQRAEWGIGQVPKIIQHKPDLVILAFGMNHQEDAATFGATMQRLLGAVQAGVPEADVVLVSPMAGNPRIFPEERFIGYREALAKLQHSGVALADVTTPWLELMRVKRYSDLSGNHVNHPNDFAHRLYAHVICALFESTKP